MPSGPSTIQGIHHRRAVILEFAASTTGATRASPSWLSSGSARTQTVVVALSARVRDTILHFILLSFLVLFAVPTTLSTDFCLICLL